MCDCTNSWGFSSTWTTSYNKCKQLPLILSNIIVDFAWFFLFYIVEEAVRFFTNLIFVLEKSIKPMFYFFSSLEIKQLRTIFWSVLTTPQGARIGLNILLDHIFNYFLLQIHPWLQIYCKLCKFGTIKKYRFCIVAFSQHE